MSWVFPFCAGFVTGLVLGGLAGVIGFMWGCSKVERAGDLQ